MISTRRSTWYIAWFRQIRKSKILLDSKNSMMQCCFGWFECKQVLTMLWNDGTLKETHSVRLWSFQILFHHWRSFAQQSLKMAIQLGFFTWKAAHNDDGWWRETKEAPGFEDSTASIQIEQKWKKWEQRIFCYAFGCRSFLGLDLTECSLNMVCLSLLNPVLSWFSVNELNCIFC